VYIIVTFCEHGNVYLAYGEVDAVDTRIWSVRWGVRLVTIIWVTPNAIISYTLVNLLNKKGKNAHKISTFNFPCVPYSYSREGLDYLPALSVFINYLFRIMKYIFQAFDTAITGMYRNHRRRPMRSLGTTGPTPTYYNDDDDDDDVGMVSMETPSNGDGRTSSSSE